MIRISQLKLQPNHTEKDLLQKLARTLRIAERDICSYEVKKQSIDARKKQELKYVYTVDVTVPNEPFPTIRFILTLSLANLTAA